MKDTMNTILGITVRVLRRDRRARNDDRHCYLEVVKEIVGNDVRNITLGEWEDDPRFVSTESVRRSRQRVQHDMPELRSDERIAKERRKLEEEFREWARS